MAIKIKAGAGLSGGLDYNTFISDYLATTETADYKFYGGTPDSVFGQTYYMNGSQVAYQYGDEAARVVMQGSDLAYDWIHYGTSYPHALSGDLDQLIFGDWVDGVTEGEQGTGEEGAITGLDEMMVIKGLDISVEPGQGAEDNGVMDVYSLLAAGDVEGLYAFLAQQAQIFVGTDGDDSYTGTAFDDKIVATLGADTYDGGEGSDMITFSNFETGVTVDLGGGTGPNGTVLSNIEDVVGSSFNDIILGSTEANSIKGGHGDDRIYGLDGDDVIAGGSGNDAIHAGSGNDSINGGGGNDDITGRLGADVMTGGTGADIFRYYNPTDGVFDSGLAQADRDLITDFKSGQDDLDFSAMDANQATDGDDAFIFLGTDKFSGEAGELRYQINNKVTVLAGDVDGDGKADFKIDLSGKIDLTELDFVL
jgi:Ca2+-binding RTX toxin-like protein